jgi:predicted phosphoribosyltransferase
VLNDEVVRQLQIPEEVIEGAALEEQEELERREAVYRAGRSLTNVKGKTVILVDDGLATGSTMRAAVQALRLMGPARIIVAAPVGAADTCEMLRNDADAVVCLKAPDNFSAVGRWYLDFTQTTDEEVSELLNQAAWECERSDAPRSTLPCPPINLE